MLQSIRDRSQSWVSIIIIGFLIVMFALWGISYYLSGNSGGSQVLAKVNDQKIYLSQFQSLYARMRQAEASQIDTGTVTIAQVKKQAFNQLITNEVMYQSANDSGLGIPPKSIDSYIASMPAFQENGVFSQDKLNQFLRYKGMTIDGLRQELLQTLVINQWQMGVYASSFALPQDIKAYWQLANQTRDFQSAQILASNYDKSVTVSKQDIQSYYKAHPEAFTAPERVQIAYLSLSLDNIAKNTKVTDDQVKSYYENNIAQFTTPEKRRVSMILVSSDQKANDIEKQLKAGKSFSDLAKANSKDPISAKKGGDLGWETISETPLVSQLFDLTKVGDVSKPFKTQYGWAIIKYTGVKQAKVSSFDQAKAQAAKDLKKSIAEKKYADVGNQLANLTFQTPNSLQPAAKQLGLKVQTTGWVTRKGASSGIASNKDVIKAAFGSDVLDAGNNSQPINISSSQAIVLRVTKHEPSKLKPLSQVEAQVKQDVINQKAMAKAKSTAQSIVKDLRAGQSVSAVAKKYGLSFKSQTAKLADQSAQAKAAFSTPVPSKAHPVAAMSEIPSKGFEVVKVDKVTLGSAPTADNNKATAMLLTRLMGMSAYEQYKQAAQSQAKITDKVNPSTL